MRTRLWTVTAILVFVFPAWAHGGDLGVEGKEGAKTHDHDHGPAHAHAEIGKPAPEFALKDLNGKEHKLSDLKGKIVVLEWTNHQCPFVKRHYGAKTMSSTLAEFKDKPVAWLAIDSSHYCADKIDAIRSFAKEQKVDYPILLDAPGKVGRAYGASSTPHMFVIDQKGILAYSGAIDDDAYGDKENKRNYVRDAISSLLEGSTVATAHTKPYGCSVKYKK